MAKKRTRQVYVDIRPQELEAELDKVIETLQGLKEQTEKMKTLQGEDDQELPIKGLRSIRDAAKLLRTAKRCVVDSVSKLEEEDG